MTDQPEALRVAQAPVSEPVPEAELMARLLERGGFTVAAGMMREQHAEIERLRAHVERWKDLATDAVSGLEYIRQFHGDLAGVGWDRVLAKKTAIDAAMQQRGMAQPVERTDGQQTARSKP